MSKYYTEAVNRAAKKYKAKNIGQVSISFQKGQGIKESFQSQAEKNGVSVNRYVLDLVRADSEGRVFVVPQISAEDVPEVMKSFRQEDEILPVAGAVLSSFSKDTRDAVEKTAGYGAMSPERLLSLVGAMYDNDLTRGTAELLIRCIEENGADRPELDAGLAALLAQ